MANDRLAWLVTTAAAASLNSLQGLRGNTSENRDALKRISRLFDMGSSHRRCPGCISASGYRILGAQGMHIQCLRRKAAWNGDSSHVATPTIASAPDKIEVLWQRPQRISEK
jgi:hypothetical protein